CPRAAVERHLVLAAVELGDAGPRRTVGEDNLIRWVAAEAIGAFAQPEQARYGQPAVIRLQTGFARSTPFGDLGLVGGNSGGDRRAGHKSDQQARKRHDSPAAEITCSSIS